MCLPMLEHVECEDPATCGPWEAGEECDRCCSSAFAAYLAKDLLGTTTPGADALRQVRAEAWDECADWVEGSNLWFEGALRKAGATRARIVSANPYRPPTTPEADKASVAGGDDGGGA